MNETARLSREDYGTFGRIEDTIAGEKQLKKWNRSWKNKLISDMKPDWKDLFIGP